MTWLGITEEESEAEKDGISKSGCWQFLAKPPMPPLGNTWIYVPPRNRPPPPGFWEPKPSGQPGGEAGGRRRPSPGRLGPQEETVASKFHLKLLAAQTCSRGGARSPSRLGGRGNRGGGRRQASSISQPKEGRGGLGSARVGVRGKDFLWRAEPACGKRRSPRQKEDQRPS